MESIKPLKYENKKGNTQNEVWKVTISGVVCFLSGLLFTNNFWWLSIIFLFVIGAFVLSTRNWVDSIMRDEILLLSKIEDTNLEIIKEEKERIEKAMKLDEKREKIVEKELQIQTKKENQIKLKKEIDDRKMKMLEMKYIRELESFNNRSNTIENLFDPNAQSILRPIIKGAQKENRAVTGQELIQSILRGMK